MTIIVFLTLTEDAALDGILTHRSSSKDANVASPPEEKEERKKESSSRRRKEKSSKEKRDRLRNGENTDNAKDQYVSLSFTT